MKTDRVFWNLWGKPVMIAIISLAGLLAALIGDGPFDLFSWIMLLVPVFVMMHFLIIKKARH